MSHAPTLAFFLASPRSDVLVEKESADYGALQFTVEHEGACLRTLFRVAKKTPKKIGYFVTAWKRDEKRVTQPFDKADNIDFLMIQVVSGVRVGYFIFPERVLLEKKIFSTNKKGGKRGFRVYAPWDKTDNAQAQKTQSWQTAYFHEEI